MYVAENALLRVRRIRQSRNGPFNVGELVTDVGEFKVKDTLIEQFDEGDFVATVLVEEIYLAQYVSFGKGVTEMRARLRDIQVQTEGQRPPEVVEQLEPDPLDEPASVVVPAPQLAPAPEPAPAAPAELSAAPAADDDGLADLYDEEVVAAISCGSTVKLDPSVDRALLRRQTAGLKARGYRFDSKSQTWNK